ncbi:hypothetical protein L3X38_040612 [Prunus dulcis]|uniref:Uncharacterized protein n=1 Tax=Prunus dulcis TaxID=3755 RepID=A0AAD4YTN5_PRUDU|nr:hypothetical protein L3X38_040612 [Prunus dulcis]
MPRARWMRVCTYKAHHLPLRWLMWDLTFGGETKEIEGDEVSTGNRRFSPVSGELRAAPWLRSVGEERQGCDGSDGTHGGDQAGLWWPG